MPLMWTTPSPVPSSPRPAAHAVLIGASAGGLSTLLEICSALPAGFPAPVLVVLHIGAHRSQLPAMLNQRCALPADFAHDGETVHPGRIYVARPDHHLLLLPGTMRLSRGPKENWTRPAIDPLFRSAALHWGDRAIGVLLAGQMDDGTAGLRAIKERDGITIVQDPDTTQEPSMPRSALDNVEVDHCLPPAEIPAYLLRLTQSSPARTMAPPSEELLREVAISENTHTSLENVVAMGRPSPLTCPECGGTLYELPGERPLRYRCHTGHAFSGLSLAGAQTAGAEDTLRSGVRALQEREMLMRRLAAVARASGREQEARAGERRADELHAKIADLVRLIEAEVRSEDG